MEYSPFINVATETGFYYLNARYYDQCFSIGKFTTAVIHLVFLFTFSLIIGARYKATLYSKTYRGHLILNFVVILFY